MKIVFGVILLSLFSTHAFAGCDSYVGKSETLEISLTTQYCATELMIAYSKLKNGKSLSTEGYKSYPFKDECEDTARGFTCRANGRTPLAGTTWDIFMGRNMKNNKPRCEPIMYVCVKGCQNTNIPKKFYGSYESTFDGECAK